MVSGTLEPVTATSGRTRTLADAVGRREYRSATESVNVCLKSHVAAFGEAYWKAVDDAASVARANDEIVAPDSVQRLAFSICANQYDVLASRALAFGVRLPTFALSITSQGGIEVALRDFMTEDLYYLSVDEAGTRRTLRQVTADGAAITVFDR